MCDYTQLYCWFNSASQVFNQAWNATINQIYQALNREQAGTINTFIIKNLIKQYLPNHLNTFAEIPTGSSIAETECPGANNSQAQ